MVIGRCRQCHRKSGHKLDCSYGYAPQRERKGFLDALFDFLEDLFT